MFHIDGMTTWPLRKASRCEVAELEVKNICSGGGGGGGSSPKQYNSWESIG